MLLLSLALFGLASAANHPQCGTKGPQGASARIVGGTNTERLEFPWQGSLRYYSPTAGWYHTCGCTLLNEQWVLTAAHCVDRSGVVDPTKYRFLGGEHDRSKNDGTEVEVTVEKIFVSPKWNSAKIDGDAALLKLSRKLDFSGAEAHLGTACLPDAEDLDRLPSANIDCIATGWGNTAWQGTSPNILQKVGVKVWKQAECTSRYAAVHPITSNMLCFGENKKGTCQGDSGGPLNCRIGNLWYNYGATSFGVQCAGPTYPSVTGRISEFSNWIWGVVDANSN